LLKKTILGKKEPFYSCLSWSIGYICVDLCVR
jgi:hypothetical protein